MIQLGASVAGSLRPVFPIGAAHGWQAKLAGVECWGQSFGNIEKARRNRKSKNTKQQNER